MPFVVSVTPRLNSIASFDFGLFEDRGEAQHIAELLDTFLTHPLGLNSRAGVRVLERGGRGGGSWERALWWSETMQSASVSEIVATGMEIIDAHRRTGTCRLDGNE